MGALRERVMVFDATVGRGILEQDSAEILGFEVDRVDRSDVEFDPERVRAGPQHPERLRVTVRCGKEAALATPRDRNAHPERLGGGRRFVEQGRIGERQAREVSNQRLEVQQRFEPALRNLGLVGGVLGVPTRILEDVALDHRRNDRVGVTHSNTRSDHAVFRRDLPEFFDQLELAGRRAFEACQFQRLAEADRRGHGVIGEFVEVRVAEALEHLGDLAVTRADVAAFEDVARFEQRSRRFSGESRVVVCVSFVVHRIFHLEPNASESIRRPGGRADIG